MTSELGANAVRQHTSKADGGWPASHRIMRRFSLIAPIRADGIFGNDRWRRLDPVVRTLVRAPAAVADLPVLSISDPEPAKGYAALADAVVRQYPACGAAASASDVEDAVLDL